MISTNRKVKASETRKSKRAGSIKQQEEEEETPVPPVDPKREQEMKMMEDELVNHVKVMAMAAVNTKRKTNKVEVVADSGWSKDVCNRTV